MQAGRSKNRSSTLLWSAGLALLVVGGAAGWLALWYFANWHGVGEISAEDVERFYVGVAALDVEANERALAEFPRLSQALPEEPAVWANLGIAQLRVSENSAAAEALARAAELAPENEQILLLQALVDERSGEFERAIERLKQISDPDPPALYMLALLVERTGSETSVRERLDLINRILEQEPQNAVAQFQGARLAARLEDQVQLSEAIDALAKRRNEWTDLAVQQFEAAQQAAAAGQFSEAAKSLTFLENVSKNSPAYQEGLLALGITRGSVGTPIREFLVTPAPSVIAADADMDLTFELQRYSNADVRPEMLIATSLSNSGPATLVAVSSEKLHLGTTADMPFPNREPRHPVGRHAILPVDLNGDFRQDLALIGSGGLTIFLQDERGGFAPWTPKEDEQAHFQPPGDGVWALDFEADGDLDLLAARDDGNSQLLRNNGDMSFTPVEALSDLPAPRELHWVDLDNDGDVDVAALDRSGQLLIAWNERAGRFSEPAPLMLDAPAAAFAVGDLDLDGEFDLAVLDRTGAIQRFSCDSIRKEWSRHEVTKWSGAPDLEASFAEGRTSLSLADLDNNGAIDLAASAGTNTAVWLRGSQNSLQRLEGSPPLFVTSVADVDSDGQLDLAGLSADGGQTAHGRGAKGYRWHVILPRATPGGGDQRINSFGLGGRIEMRAGRLLQAAPIDGPQVRFGLGQHQRAAVARIVWPDGSAQAEFDLASGQSVTAQQRLKGSCPFVFARGDDGLVFVKDFIWRSPLGLKINSQDTAGVNQTEDWIRIPGELLTPRNGVYDVRITAELWETHFFDHVSLMAVDHPATVEAYVDERFIAARSPALAVTAVMPLQPLRRAFDELGRDVSSELHAIDGEYLDSFELGKFQGVAAEHWVECELDENLPVETPIYLIGNGWIYPTDSSLNVAISQGDFPRPHGLILEAPHSDGGWRAVSDDLGFPAGKNKTVLIPLPQDLLQAGQRRFRLRTNLEIYWDSLAWAAAAPEGNLETRRVETAVAELRHRGFSELSPLDRRKPDLPNYDRLSGLGQRWRDLEGYYTRLGDVRELLDVVDDRYVIMNAGDEIVLQFAAADPPPAGWKRDFVLIGDGWVKDGNYNTTHSRTVHPLPTHGDADYSSLIGAIFDDPLYQKHLDDWRRFHTRYLTPHHFARGLWPAGGWPSPEETNETR